MASQSMEVVAKAVEQQMLQSARMVEEQLDAELEKLQTMDDDDLERLKERRLEALKKAQKQKQVGVLNILSLLLKCLFKMNYLHEVFISALKQIRFHLLMCLNFVNCGMCVSSGVDI